MQTAISDACVATEFIPSLKSVLYKVTIVLTKSQNKIIEKMGKFATLTAVAGAELLIIFGFLGLGAFGYAQRPDPASNVVPLAAVVLGSIAACVSFCGLVGAIYRSKFMVTLF